MVVDAAGKPVGTVSDGDACICFNYRADRVRQITRVLARNSGLTKNEGKELPGAEDLDQVIPRAEVPKQLHYVCMTQYDKQFSLPMVILPESMENLLADMLAQANLRNLRIAETEKYAHVTYFITAALKNLSPVRTWALVPSQKVATYDLAPEMSAGGIADAVIKAIGDPAFDLVVVNFANADMVGHSGKLEPTIQGVETIDACLGPHLSDSQAAWRLDADYRGPRQCGVDDRSRDRGPAHLAHHEPGPRDPGERRCRQIPATRGRLVARYFSHLAGHAWTGEAGTHVRVAICATVQSRYNQSL